MITTDNFKRLTDTGGLNLWRFTCPYCGVFQDVIIPWGLTDCCSFLYIERQRRKLHE